ncbi:MAG: plastocyanin/azurin family copper-binding protein [Myxococcota bacterium]
MRVKISMVMGLLSAALTHQAAADEHIIKGVITNWVPQVTYAKPGDTIKFVQMAGHDTQTIDGMIPEGATPWKAAMGAEGFSVTLDKEGAYIFKCNPHMTTGMVGAVIVGEGAPKNLAALDTSAESVKLGKNMVVRTIRKMKEDLKKKGLIQ